MSVNVLKDKLILSSPALSQMLKRMENAWYIKRVLWVKDKREVEILPTKLWKELYDQINQKYFDLATQTLTEISWEKKEECFTTLCELQKILEKTRFE
jgi:DNA-binding MarR family transcriptional regulator